MHPELAASKVQHPVLVLALQFVMYFFATWQQYHTPQLRN